MVGIPEALVHIQITHKHIAHNPSYKLYPIYFTTVYLSKTNPDRHYTRSPGTSSLPSKFPRTARDPSRDIGFAYNGKMLQPLTSRSIHVQTLPPPVASGWARFLVRFCRFRCLLESRLYGEEKLNRWRTFYWNIDASADLAITVPTVPRHTLKYLSSLVIGGISGELSFYQSLQEQQLHNDDRRRPDIRDPAMPRYIDIDDVSMSRRPDVDDVSMSLRLNIDDVSTSRRPDIAYPYSQ
ncbi:hypothetical protein F5879DRAFT_925099 [Lentinula edodes]|nr:hypothetical protein F5879DRAFT_925099 [Lentinula edodes]